MTEFVSRIAAQRELLAVVNAKNWPKEDLYSLSSKAIERWMLANGLDPHSRLSKLIYGASEKLFFLANKSQEQITDEYKALSQQFDLSLQAIKSELTCLGRRI